MVLPVQLDGSGTQWPKARVSRRGIDLDNAVPGELRSAVNSEYTHDRVQSILACVWRPAFLHHTRYNQPDGALATLTLARHTAVLGALLAAALAPGAAGRQADAGAGAAPKPHQSGTAGADISTGLPDSLGKPTLSPAERTHNSIAALPQPAFNNTAVVLDPAHGGSDNGSRISDSIVEKDVTLALAFRLRSLLTARGFTVVLTRENDAATSSTPPFSPLSLDDRAGVANHERAAACLLLHATSRGTGVHLYSSELDPAPRETLPQPWLTGQAPWLNESQALASRMSDALTRSRLPLVSGSASVRPLDSLTCPALVVELAPGTDDPASINDEGYQQRVAEAVAGALVFWKDSVQPPEHAVVPIKPSSTEEQP